VHATFEPRGEYRIASEAGQRAPKASPVAPSRVPTGDVSLMSATLLGAEERFEIAVESLQELVDLDDVVDRDRLA
jgi:hypothetical protein